jgi:putative endopeptidase
MDPRVAPCDDFYKYACGGWVSTHPVPSDRSQWSRFAELAQNNREKSRKILEADLVETANRTADQKKLGDFYASCLDEPGIEKAGLKPVQPELDRITAVHATADLPQLLGALRIKGVPALFSFRSGQDFKDATQVIANVDAGGLSLPDRDYYLKTDEKSVKERAGFHDHVAKMFVLLGEPQEQAGKDADAVLAIETELAKASFDRVSRRDPNKVYHRMSREELAALTPSFSWTPFLSALDAPAFQSVNVSEPEFMKAVESSLKTTPIDQWKAYLRWHAVHASAQWLPKAFADEDFAFFGKTLGGAKEQRARWERCVDLTDRALGDALGREFVAANFNPEAKKRTFALVGELDKAMEQDITNLSWMGAETKVKAKEKLGAIANKIGYPDKWRDYSSLKIVKGDLIGDVERADAFETKRRLDKIGKPLDRLDWGMTPPTVNAYYSSSMNDINFPAGILQTPFYDPRRDDALNYGGIGAVIGHEMTHGFDDAGRQFDGKGNLSDWWTEADATEFKTRATCIADEYSGFSAAGGLKVNGRLTLGENAADNGGLRIAYMAYENSVSGKPKQALDGLTPEQRFFVGFAQVWCGNATDEAERMQVLTNPHSPGRYRVDGTVVNMPEFQQAFHCAAGSAMSPENRCRIW